MKIGVSVPTLVGGNPVDVTLLAQKAEDLGFESFWVPEHPIMPVRTLSRRPGPDDTIPHTYSYMVDPFVALARVSAVTTTLKLGTAVCLVPERNPLLLAKVIATLDHYSGGRFLFGIGAGWLREETEIMGGNFTHRWSQTREAVLAMKELWGRDEAEYHGRYYDFPPVRCFPKPVQNPHPPVLLGGTAKNVLQRVVAWGDGWLPNWITPDEIRESRARLDDLAAEAGRDSSSIEITAYGQLPDLALIDSFGEAGAGRVTVRIQGTSTQEAVASLESLARKVLG